MSAEDFRSELRRRGVLLVGVSGPIGAGKTTLCETIVAEFDGPIYVRNFADALKEQVATHHNIPLAQFYTRNGKARVIDSTGHTVGRTLQLWGTALREGVAAHIWIIALQSWLERSVLPHCAPESTRWSHDVSSSVVERRANEMPLLDACDDEAEDTEDDSLHNDDKITGAFPKSFAQFGGYYRPNAIVFIGDVRLPNEFFWLRDTCGGLIVKVNGDPAGVREHEARAATRDMNHVSETALANEEVFCPDVIIDTDELDRSSAAAHLIDSLTLFAVEVQHRDRFFDFYRFRLRPLVDAVVCARREHDGQPIDARVTGKLLFDNAFGEQDYESLFAYALVEKATQWVNLQRYVVWLAERAQSSLLDRYIADWHSIFYYCPPYTRFLKYVEQI